MLKCNSYIFLIFVFIGLNTKAQSDTYLSTLSATTDTTGQYTQLEWEQDPNTTYLVSKKNLFDNFWSTIGNNINSDKFIDEDSQIGVPAEYRLVNLSTNVQSFVYGGNEVYLPVNRGRIMLLVDQTHVEALEDLTMQWIKDAEGDGWEVIQQNVERTMPVPDVKALIKSAYDEDEGLNAVFIVGHVPVPYSGNIVPDGHSNNHRGAWAADVYYAEMNEIWTDESVTTSGQPARTNNVPGDGKFDKSSISAAELEVGRVDFFNMPTFEETELELLRKYFIKNHAFKTKQFTPKMQAVAIDNFNAGFDLPADVNFPVMVDGDYITANYRNSLQSDSYIWSFGAGGGSYTSASGIGNTANLAADSLQGVFTMLFGSYFGDWDTQNNFLRAALGSGTILTNTWGNRPSWTFFHMGLGANIGQQARLTQSDKWYISGFSRSVHIALLGDPTLRMVYVEPTTNLTAELDGNSVVLNWEVASMENEIENFVVYRKYENESNYIKLGEVEVSNLEFTDDDFEAGFATYLVRSQKLELTPSGSYYNNGLGSIVSIDLPLLDQDNDGYFSDVDCDDLDENVNPGITEMPYNNIDDDCDPATLDDDLDQDGYVLEEDCDDNNPNINPSQIEIIYNGLDDDCEPSTLDDDLDQDGYVLEEDCDDNNPDINPDADDIPNNDIDEDCDGMDLISSIHELSNSTINIYPNPAIDIVNLDVNGDIDFSVSLFDLNGRLILTSRNENYLNIHALAQGLYLLEISDVNTGQKVVERLIVGD